MLCYEMVLQGFFGLFVRLQPCRPCWTTDCMELSDTLRTFYDPVPTAKQRNRHTHVGHGTNEREPTLTGPYESTHMRKAASSRHIWKQLPTQARSPKRRNPRPDKIRRRERSRRPSPRKNKNRNLYEIIPEEPHTPAPPPARSPHRRLSSTPSRPLFFDTEPWGRAQDAMPT